MRIAQNQQARIPVRCINSSGTGVTGMTAADALGGVATAVKADGTTEDITLVDDDNWIEIDATKAPGLYHVVVPDTATDVEGAFQLSVVPAASAFIATVIAIEVDGDYLRRFVTSKWQIHTSGPYANQMVFYEDDGETPWLKFDLQDSVGDPTYLNPFARVPNNS